jgi:rare lipoprotein A
MIRSFCLLLLLFISACAPRGRYQQHQDSPPSTAYEPINAADASPKYEAYKPANFRSYTIRGVRYTPMSTGKGYSAQGEASWYGQKFHGHLTSNGEVYDMYTMSAAHKTLPLPSFGRVTNLANGKQVIVRINDRGPFHGGRLIDLSYAAATKLDMLSTGVAQVKLDVIHVAQDGQITVGNSPTIKTVNPPALANNKSLFIQVAALSDQQKVKKIGKGLSTLYQLPHHTPEEKGMFRLQLGPIDNEQQATELLSHLKKNGYMGAYKVYLSE